MANFNHIKITKAGAALLASSISDNSKVEFSHIAIGSGELAEEQDISTMTDLVSPVMDLPIESITSEGGAVILTANLSTASVPETFMHREVGIYASNALIAYGNAGDEYDAIPATGEATALSKKIKIILNIAPGVTSFRDIDSEQFVTYAGLEARIGDAVLLHAKEAAAMTIEDKVASGEVLNIDGFNELLSSGYETLTRETPSGSDNATCNIIILDPAHVPNARLTEISYLTGSSTAAGMTTDPIYLAVWEAKEGSDTDYELAGVSSNTVTQTLNATLTWTFDRPLLHGRRLKLVPTLDPSNTQEASVQLRIRTSTSTDTTVCINNGTSYSFTPQITLVALNSVARFAPYNHTENKEIHITAAEREKWNTQAETLGSGSGLSSKQTSILAAFDWDTLRGLSVVHATDGVTDGRLRLMVTQGYASIVSAHGMTIQSPCMALMGATGYAAHSDTSSNINYCYYGHTLSDTEMFVYGITEACVWSGDPHLPLNLRYSDLKLNGTVLDTTKLTMLINNADDLIALLSA